MFEIRSKTFEFRASTFETGLRYELRKRQTIDVDTKGFFIHGVEMNNLRKVSKEASRQGEKIEAAGKPEESIGCPGIHNGPANTLHSRIKRISPHLLKILKKQ